MSKILDGYADNCGITSGKAYRTWYGIMHRTSKGDDTVCEDWKRLEVFDMWFDLRFHEGHSLTKLIMKGLNNTHYSPETCCLVPKEFISMIQGWKPVNWDYKEAAEMYYLKGLMTKKVRDKICRLIP